MHYKEFYWRSFALQEFNFTTTIFSGPVHLSVFTRMMRRSLGSSVFENTRHLRVIKEGIIDETKRAGMENGKKLDGIITYNAQTST